MKKPKTAGKKNKPPKAKAKSLKVKTSVKAGSFSWGEGAGSNRCEILRRKV